MGKPCVKIPKCQSSAQKASISKAHAIYISNHSLGTNNAYNEGKENITRQVNKKIQQLEAALVKSEAMVKETSMWQWKTERQQIGCVLRVNKNWEAKKKKYQVEAYKPQGGIHCARQAHM
jgi:hypothetical protein